MKSFAKKIYSICLTLLLSISVASAQIHELPSDVPTVDLSNPQIPKATLIRMKALIRDIEISQSKLDVINAMGDATLKAKIGNTGELALMGGVAGWAIALRFADEIGWMKNKLVPTVVLALGTLAATGSFAYGAYTAYKNRYYHKIRTYTKDELNTEVVEVLNDSQRKIEELRDLSLQYAK